MASLLYSALSKMRTNAGAGLWHALGAVPHSRGPTGAVEWQYMNQALKFTSGSLLPEIASGKNPSLLDIGVGVVNPVLMTLGAVGGYSTGGLRGAFGSLTQEVASNSAMVRHGYHEIAGEFHMGAGMAAQANRLLRPLGGTGALAGSALGLADYAHRFSMGAAVGMAANTVLGGGALGAVGAMVGTEFGVKYAGTISAGLGLMYATKAISYGTYNVLRSGYEHRQRQRGINTDGDMSAFMTQSANTMRERSLQAIQRSGMNVRSALGNEGQYLSFAGRNYSSPYRNGY